MLAITPKAREMLDSFAEQADQGELSLRVEIVGRGPKVSNMICNLLLLTEAQRMTTSTRSME